MGRMRAVDHVVSGTAAGRAVDLLDRVLQRLARGQPSVRFQGEGDRRGHGVALRRARDADGLVHVGHGDGGDHVGAGFGEGADLRRVIGLGLGWAHHLAGIVAVAARPTQPLMTTDV